MPDKRPSAAHAPRILHRQQPVKAEELAAANRAIDAWQASVWTLPLAERQSALVTLLEVLHG